MRVHNPIFWSSHPAMTFPYRALDKHMIELISNKNLAVCNIFGSPGDLKYVEVNFGKPWLTSGGSNCKISTSVFSQNFDRKMYFYVALSCTTSFENLFYTRIQGVSFVSKLIISAFPEIHSPLVCFTCLATAFVLNDAPSQEEKQCVLC